MQLKAFALTLVLAAAAAPASAQVIISLLLGDKLNSGQVEFGLEGGVTYSWQTATPYGKALPTFNLGFYFDIKTKNPKWLIHTGVIVKGTLGAAGLPAYSLNDPNLDNLFASGTVERTLGYFSVPFFAKRKLGNSFYVEVGPVFGLKYNGEDRFSALVNGQELTYAVDIGSQYRTLDAGFGFGFGYRLMGGNGMNVGIRGYQGLVNVLETNPGASVTNQAVYLTVGIPIGAGKAREREAAKEKK